MNRKLPSVILVAVDGSKPSMEAARYAMRLALGVGAKVHFVHVVEMSGAVVAGSAGTGAWTQMLSSMHESARGIVGMAQREAQELKVPHEVQVVEAIDVTAGILHEANDCDAGLIVVGSHGRRGIRRLVLGSVAEKVVRSATVPVLVAR